MRAAPLAAVLVTSAALAGGASPVRDIEALTRKHVASLAALEDDAKLGFAKDPLVVGLEGPESYPGGVASKLHMSGPDITHTVKSVAVGVDEARGVAWVQAPFHYKLVPQVSPESGEGNLWLISEGDMRFGALVVREGTAWKLAAVDYSGVISDAALVKDPRTWAPEKTLPAEGPARVLAGWFDKGLAAHAATGVTLLASGTSPAELASGAAAGKLVAKWDKLGLFVMTAEARTFGDYAVVTATVALPVKKAHVDMALFAILRHDSDDWHWVALQYSP